MAFPPELRRFVSERISSVAVLEVLLLLRSAPGTDWSAETVGRELATYPEVAGHRLSELVALRLASETSEGRFRYAPATEQDAQLVDQLADAFGKRRVAVIELIFGNREAPARHFADAFLIRQNDREDDDG